MPEPSVSPSLPQLYALQRRRAVAIARRVLRDADAAEDVVQEVFTRLLLRPHLAGPEATTPGWLRRVVVNACINWMRSQARRRRLTLEPTPAPCPEQQVLGVELQAHFEAALAGIPERQRQVVWLREMRGLSYPDIALRLGLPEGTVKSSLHRGRERVQRELLATLG